MRLYSVRKEINICGAMPDGDNKKFWGDWHYAVALKKEFEKRGYRANIITREHWYDKSSAKYVLVLRGLKPYYPQRWGLQKRYYIMWNISHPADVSIAEYNLYDYVFFASSKMKRQIGEQIDVPSEVLLQCTDPDVMRADDQVKQAYELLFVGNSRHVYRQILKDLLPTEHHLTVYGRQWKEFPVYPYVVKKYLDNKKVGQAYHDAKILLNDHWADMRQYGIISNRIFDALACGAFVISDDMPEISEVFGDAVVTYTDREDLKQKIDYYLGADEERKHKAQLGRQLVRAEHTFAKRVECIINRMETL